MRYRRLEFGFQQPNGECLRHIEFRTRLERSEFLRVELKVKTLAQIFSGT
jgi:hypothetical protein